jgi:hypothetical protein
MSVNQRAMINGLLAENLGKNDLVRGAEAKANEATNRASDAEHSARFNQFKIDRLEAEAKNLKEENKKYKELLSLPMKEIAEVSGDFRKTYFEQQKILADWILGQQAYRETAKIFAAESGKSKEEFSKVYNDSVNAVLTNQTEHDNNASEYQVLADHATTILAIRKKNGKA